MTEIQGVLSQMVMDVVQSETEPLEGISTSPSTSRPTWVLHTHQQHMADYICLIVKAGISLPRGEDWLVPIVTEVFPLFFLYSLFMLACILPLALYLHSFITVSSFPPSHPDNPSV